MTQDLLITAVDDNGVARLTMNRPDLRNAFNEKLICEICDALGRLTQDSGVRVIVLTGAGKAFSAGADLNMMKRVAGYTPTQNRDDARRLAHMLASIHGSPKPIVALVNGPAMGGGVGLVAACDIAIGATDAFFAFSEARLGLVPAVISPFVIEAIGVRQARRYFITGERFDAATAREIGLLHIVAPADALEAALNLVIANLLSCAPLAQHEAKELINAVAHQGVTERILDDTAGRIARLRASPEGQEGVTAFLEKRAPNWAKSE